MAAEQLLDAVYGRAGRRDGQLLAGDLEQQRAEQIHAGQPGSERLLGVEGWPLVDEPGQHGIGVAEMRTCPMQPLRMAGITSRHV